MEEEMPSNPFGESKLQKLGWCAYGGTIGVTGVVLTVEMIDEGNIREAAFSSFLSVVGTVVLAAAWRELHKDSPK